MYFFGKLGQEPDSLMCSLDLKQFLIFTQFNRCTFKKKKKKRDFGATEFYQYSVLLCCVIIMIPLQVQCEVICQGTLC